MSKKVTLNADNTAATLAEPTISDLFTSLIDPDVAVTGMYKYMQLAGVAAVGAMASNRMHTGSFTNFGSKSLLN